MRRGGEGGVLNSKSEFSRCKITQRTLEQTVKDEILENKTREQETNKAKELDSWLDGWEQVRNKAREQERGSMTALIGGAKKTTVEKRRELPAPEGRSKPKKLKYATLENWGEAREDGEHQEQASAPPPLGTGGLRHGWPRPFTTSLKASFRMCKSPG